MTSASHTGPSAAAIRRLNRVLLCILDNPNVTPSEVKRQLSDPMSRKDLDSAFRRLMGAEQIERVPDVQPVRWRVTLKGERIAHRLIHQGERY